MIGYVTLGVSNMERAKNFYVELLKDKGASVLIDMDRIAFIGKSMDQPMIAVCIPFNEEPNHPGNGNMLGFNAGSRENVDKMYERAISLGATDDGPPGPRIPEYNGVVYDDVVFYGAYFKDADGNKAVFYKLG